jgi:hypothetical protein
MQSLSNTVSTCFDDMKAQGILNITLRADINGEDWKIIINSRDETYSNINIKLKRRPTITEEVL